MHSFLSLISLLLISFAFVPISKFILSKFPPSPDVSMGEMFSIQSLTSVAVVSGVGLLGVILWASLTALLFRIFLKESL